MYGFLSTRYKHPLPCFVGPMEELLTERMNGDFAEVNQTHNFLFYRRVTPTAAAPSYIFFQIPDLYYYHLDGLRVFYPLTAGGDEPADAQIQLSHVALNRELSPDEIPARIETSPAFQQRIRYMVKVNHTFFPADKIQVRVSIAPGTGRNDPAYVDIVAEGIRIPKDFVTQE